MIYGFARQSGGAVRIQSVEGHGTTMTIILPRCEGQGSIADEPDEPGSAPRIGTGYTVLVVDDEPAVRVLVAEVLRELRYTALEAESGAAALAIIASGARIDLLITELDLPGGIDGRRVAGMARQSGPALVC